MDRNSLAMDRDSLIEQIKEWNANRLDLFALSLPDEKLEFYGVMRFFYQDAGAKVATKCVRVGSHAQTPSVVDTLIEKFRPDMRMLSMDRYCLYEVHANRDERKLEEQERPLLVQLNWGRDDREGRFLLKREADVTAHMEGFHERPIDVKPLTKNDKKRLSKREKKDLKKKEKQAKLNKGKENETPGEQLYKELPETSFTRTISNPDAVMRRRRQQKLERKMQEFRAKDGGPDGGGTLKVFGHTLNPDVPYKTLLLSTEDTAEFVVRETLEKYQMDKADPKDYCLFMLHLVPADDGRDGNVVRKEEILNDDECPLGIQLHHHPERGSLLFEIRKTPPNAVRRTRSQSFTDVGYPGMNSTNLPPNKLPYLVELHPDGSEPFDPVRHRLQADVLEIGSERSMQSEAQHLRLLGPHILPHHCVIAHSEGVVTLTPLSRDADIYVNNQLVMDTTVLQDGMVLRFGPGHVFRFKDPLQEEKQMRRSGEPYDGRYEGNFDGSFDIEGHVEASLPPGARLDRRGHDQPKRSPDGPRQVEDDLLPAGLQFMEEAEDHFLSSVILNPAIVNQIQFKLAPTYTLYMALRYRLSRHYRPDMPQQERTHRMANLVDKMAGMMQEIVKENPEDANVLAFWMANASELLHFFKKDDNISPYTADSLDLLAGVVQLAFRSLVNVLQTDLEQSMSAFLDEANQDDEIEEDGDENLMNQQYGSRPVMSDVIGTLSAAMSLMRRCRVNAALTIQLFSLLFHFINMWLFNRIVLEPRLQLCSHYWGVLLKRRLQRIEIWAEKQGLELAADCHLARIVQAAYLLQCPKYSPDEAANITALCFKLNSLQIRVLLQSYIPERDEPYIPQELITRLVRMAESTADEMCRSEGRNVHLEEDPDLHLPFLLPEDGYSCEIITDIPNGLPEFVEPLNKSGLCTLIPHQNVTGAWTVYMDSGQAYDQNVSMSPEQYPSPVTALSAELAARNLPPEPDLAVVQFDKVRGSLGLSIVAAQGENQKERGVYVKAVVPGGAADLDGRIQAGDQLLEVDGRSLVGLTQEEAAKQMTQTGNRVTLKVAVQGAVYHGLETMLSKPSPPMTRAADARGMMPPGEDPRNQQQQPPHFGSRDNVSPGFHGNAPGFHGNPPGYPGNQRGLSQQQMAQSRSTPALNDQFSVEPYRDDFAQGPPASKDRSKSVSSLNRQEPPFDEERRRLQSTGSAMPARDPRFNQTSSHPSLNMSREDMQPYRDDGRYANFQPNKAVPGGQEPQPRGIPGQDPRMPTQDPRAMQDQRGLPDQRGIPGQDQRGMPDPRSSTMPNVHMRHGDRDRPNERPKSALIPSHREENLRLRPRSEDIDADMAPDWRQMDRNRMSLERNQAPPTQMAPLHVSPHEPNLKTAQISPSRVDPPNLYENARRDPSPSVNDPRLSGPHSPNERFDPRTDPRFDPRNEARDPRIDPRGVWNGQRDPRNEPRDSRNLSRDPRFDPRNEDPRIDPRNEPQRFDQNYDSRDPRNDSRVDYRDPRNQDPRNVTRDGRMDDFRDNGRFETRDPRNETRDPRNDEILYKDARIDWKPDPRFEAVPKPDVKVDASRPRLSVHARLEPGQLSPTSMPQSQPPSSPQRSPDRGSWTPPGRDDLHQTSASRLNRTASPDFPPPPELPDHPPPDDEGDLPPPPPPPQNYQPSPQFQPVTSSQFQPVTSQFQPVTSQPYNNRYSGSFSQINQGPAPFGQTSNQITSIRFQPQKPPVQPKPDRSSMIRDQKMDQPQSRGSVDRNPAMDRSLDRPLDRSMDRGPNQNERLASTSSLQVPSPRNSLLMGGSLERSASPWDRDQREQEMKRQEEELARMRDDEVALLEAKPHLTPEEQARLQRLRLDQEFRRRVAELPKDDEEEDENEIERQERVANRERMVKMVKEDLERTHKMKAQREELEKQEESRREEELRQKQEHRLRMFEKEREEERLKQQRKHEKQEREQEQLLRKQRELHEKARQEQEENRRFIQEEEKRIEAKRLEEIKRKKDQERQQLREIEAAREAEEEQKRQKEKMALIRQESREEFHKPSYLLNFPQVQQPPSGQQPNQGNGVAVPQPPARGSSYAMLNRRPEKDPNVESDLFMRGFQPARNTDTPTKKSVSFDSRLATEITDPRALAAANSEAQRFPPPTVQRYEPNARPYDDQYQQNPPPTNQRQGQYSVPDNPANQRQGQYSMAEIPANQRPGQYQVMDNPANQRQGQYQVMDNPANPRQGQYSVSGAGAFQQANQQAFMQYANNNTNTSRGPPPATPPKYASSRPSVGDDANYVVKTTPGVVGAQEVYRDPRERALAAKQRQGEGEERPGEQMSFRDKMKMFAETAGENTPKSRVKSSRSQRVLEMNLAM